MYYSRMESEKKTIEEKIKRLEEKIDTYPEGEVRTAKNGKYHRLYYYGSGERRYLAGKDAEFKNLMVRKKYYTSEIEDLVREKTAIEAALKKYGRHPSSVQEFWTNAAYVKALQVQSSSVENRITEWMKEPYESNQNHPEQLRYQSPSGNIVRSKSEIFIDQALYLHQIPYRYECRLVLGEAVFFPDFTIMHPKTEEIFFWEHFGMMDNQNYANSSFQKLSIYVANKIIPGHRLIVTFESKDNPLDLREVEHIIQQKLC